MYLWKLSQYLFMWNIQGRLDMTDVSDRLEVMKQIGNFCVIF